MDDEMKRCINTLNLIIEYLYDTNLGFEMEDIKGAEEMVNKENTKVYRLGFIMGMEYSVKAINKFKSFLSEPLEQRVFGESTDAEFS